MCFFIIFFYPNGNLLSRQFCYIFMWKCLYIGPKNYVNFAVKNNVSYKNSYF